MSTESLVISTTEMRLEQNVATLEWLIARHPGHDALMDALEAVYTALIVVRNIQKVAENT